MTIRAALLVFQRHLGRILSNDLTNEDVRSFSPELKVHYGAMIGKVCL